LHDYVPLETIIASLDLPEGAKPLEMSLIPHGTFTMGVADGELDSITREEDGRDWYPHQVTIQNDLVVTREARFVTH
jgi:hypothetical protein